MSETTTDTARDPRLPPRADRSDWLVLRILRPYTSWAGPMYATGESAAFSPAEAATMVALGWARRADEPAPETVVLLPQRVRFTRGFCASGATFGANERAVLDGETAAKALRSGAAVLDDGVETLTPQAAKLARARERRLKARGGR